MNRKTWTWGFLGVTALAIILEFLAIFDGNSETLPWTYFIINYVPAWVAYPAIASFAIWLIFHLKKYYPKS